MSLSRRIFISAVAPLAPGVPDAAGLLRLALRCELAPEGEAQPGIRSRFDGALEQAWHPEAGCPDAPPAKDLKMLRREVVAASVAVGALLRSAQLEPAWREHLPLYVATGFCLDALGDNITQMTAAYLHGPSEAVEARNKGLYEITHPLFALRSLTNAAESYIAQAHGIRGENTTFGSTSHAGFDAIEEGMARILSGHSERAVVGAVNGCGPISSLSYSGFAADGDDCGKASDAVAFLLLESEQGLAERGARALAEITELKAETTVPRLFEVEAPRPLSTFAPETKGELVLLPAGLSRGLHHADLAEARQHWRRAFSWQEALGNLGATSLLFHIATAALMVQSPDGPALVDCIDRDPYGRLARAQIRRLPG